MSIERPILFSAPMVRALLAGTKTQTRRMVKRIGVYEQGGRVVDMVPLDADGDPRDGLARCPYGATGDRLWVREAWFCDDFTAGDHKAACSGHVKCKCTDADRIAAWRQELYFRADAPNGRCCELVSECCCAEVGSPWKPSIHMPRWASRITLEVTGVRVERLQAISEADAKAEGAEPLGITFRNDSAGRPHIEPSLGGPYRDGYRVLWESINGAGSWEANPWVWVVEFRRLP